MSALERRDREGEYRCKVRDIGMGGRGDGVETETAFL